MEGEEGAIRKRKTSHLKELMSDAKLYGWECTRTFHGAWLNQLEQVKRIWMDDEKFRFRQAFVWHPSSSPPLAIAPVRTSPWTRQHKHPGGYKATARSGTKACKAYNEARGGKSKTH